VRMRDAVLERQDEDLAVADLPSSPVRPALMMALTVVSTNSSLTAICNLTLRSRLTVYSVAAIDLGVAFLAANP